MTTFQLVMLGLFAVVVVAAYRKELLGLLTRRNRSTEQSIALTIVNDLVAVTELRDKLAAENCPQGVEACTALLRVIVEHTQKNVG